MKDFHEEMVEKYGLPSWLPNDWMYKEVQAYKKKPVFGIGINDVEFSCQPTINGVRAKHLGYVSWQNMLSRCYDAKVLERQPAYIGTTVCSEWHKFSNFLVWFNKNFNTGLVLDKDILYRYNKMYSPETCLYVQPIENTFIITCTRSRGELPLGVCTYKNKGFRATISTMQDTGKHTTKMLGVFEDPLDAHYMWQRSKLEQCIDLIENYNCINLIHIRDRLLEDIKNNLITEVL